MKAIEKPEYWCKEWYLDKKNRGYKDVLKKWKKELGLSGYGRKNRK